MFSPLNSSFQCIFLAEVAILLPLLASRQRDVAHLRLGLDGSHDMLLLKEIGQRLGIRANYARYLYTQAVRKLQALAATKLPSADLHPSVSC